MVLTNNAITDEPAASATAILLIDDLYLKASAPSVGSGARTTITASDTFIAD